MSLTKEDLRGKRFWQVVPEHHHYVLDDMIRAEDFFAELDVMPDRSASSPPCSSTTKSSSPPPPWKSPRSFNAKYSWLERHFPFIPHTHIVFCGDKSILRADYLIDDNPSSWNASMAPASSTTHPTT